MGSDALERRVRAALGTVRDPELDEPITDLGFVQDLRVDGGEVRVELRLPTYFCAPNFAYLMVADAHDAVDGVTGVVSTSVVLVDHFSSDEINKGVAAAHGFSGSFPGLADDELSELRLTFQRKAHRACQERVASRMAATGLGTAELASASLGDAEPGPELDRLVRRRADLGLRADAGAGLLMHDDGRRIEESELPVQLRLARTTRISIEGNSGLCRGLLSVRYNLDREAG